MRSMCMIFIIITSIFVQDWWAMYLRRDYWWRWKERECREWSSQHVCMHAYPRRQYTVDQIHPLLRTFCLLWPVSFDDFLGLRARARRFRWQIRSTTWLESLVMLFTNDVTIVLTDTVVMMFTNKSVYKQIHGRADIVTTERGDWQGYWTSWKDVGG